MYSAKSAIIEKKMYSYTQALNDIKISTRMHYMHYIHLYALNISASLVVQYSNNARNNFDFLTCINVKFTYGFSHYSFHPFRLTFLYLS